MFKRWFRLPSPAMVISMVALSLVLGGTAVAASTGGDRAADAKLIKKLAKSLSVKHAKTAANATTAANASALGGLPATAYLQKTATLTGDWSCAGTAFKNERSTESYSAEGSEKYATGGSALFRCSVDIPDGATVTAVHFGVEDGSASNANCAMWRTNTASSVGTETEMASVSSSGTPGATQISTTTIDAPTIDNANYAYFVQCALNGSDDTLGLYGATVAYSVSAQHATVHTPSISQSRSSSSSTVK